MKIVKYNLLCAAALILSISAASSQSLSPDLIKQAAAMGYSEADIKTQIGAQKSQATTTQIAQTSEQRYVVGDQQMRAVPVVDSNYALADKPESNVELENIIDQNKSVRITFGQDFFRNNNVSFESNINIPTPKDYVLTPGDEVVVTIWGDTELLYKELISPDGVINIPNYGPINLSGMRIDEATKSLEKSLSKVYNSLGSTSQLMVSLGQIGSIKVNVSGEVANPGTYTVPSVASLFHILHLSGGTSEMGDMRNIELYRDSELVTSLDLYDYIFNGNAAGNTTLMDGDIVVVKPFKARISAMGEVKRPMYYQIKEGESVENILDFVGGFNDTAYKQEVKIYRNAGKDRELMVVEKDAFAAKLLMDGDSLVVSPANNEYKNIVTITGAVWRGGDFQFNDEVKSVNKLIEKAGGLKGNAFATRGMITRRNEDYTTSMISFVTADVARGVDDIELQNYDKVNIPTIESLRERYSIVVLGEVNASDTLEYHQGMSIEDAIIMAGGLKESASLATLDVTRRIMDKNSMTFSNDVATTYNFQINEDLTMNESTKDFALEPFDLVVVRRSPQYKKQERIFIMGEVLFPGTYTMTKGNTYLSDVVNMAKGLTPNAYIKGTSLTRQARGNNKNLDDVNNQELFTVENISNLALNQLKNATTGRDTLNVTSRDIKVYSVGVDMEKALKDPHGPEDVILQENDIVIIPKQINIINIIGAVNYPNATSYTSKKMKHYISEGGGFSRMAIKKPFVIYQNGKVASTKSFLGIKRRPKIDPGSMVVVPAKANRDRASLAETVSAVASLASVASSISTLGLAISK